MKTLQYIIKIFGLRFERPNSRILTKLSLFAVCMILIINACKRDMPVLVNSKKDYTLKLSWYQAYSSETKEQVETGLLWAFCFMGAQLPVGNWPAALNWNANILQINIEKIGFNQQALYALNKLFLAIRQNEEYKRKGDIDIGRFIMLTINSSNHYYAITGLPKRLEDFIKNKRFDLKQSAIIESTVSKIDRIVEMPDTNYLSTDNFTFIAKECKGNVIKDSFETDEFEVCDLMPNGQLRFGIYSADGNLINAANVQRTYAGKPSKCLWCHEIRLQKSFAAVTAVTGYYTPSQFNDKILRFNDFINNYRTSLSSDLSFNKTQDHTQMELLYISFMEPTIERIAHEWNMTIAEATAKVAGLKTHTNAEFPFADKLYDRKDIDFLSKYAVMNVPESAREKSNYEPNLID